MNKNIVDIRSGEVLNVCVEQPAPSDYNPSPRARFYFPSEIRKDGTPDRRSRGHVLGVRMGYRNLLEGSYALENPMISEAAAFQRAEIARLESELEVAKQQLLSLYR